MSIKDSLMINENTDAGIARVLAMLGTTEGSESILEILGQTGDTGGSETAGTVMAKLNALQNKPTSPFKSWNRYTYINGTDVNASVTIPITPVDASRSFVIVERLRERYDWLTRYDFTLEDTQINLEHEQASKGYLQMAFTVIELY